MNVFASDSGSDLELQQAPLSGHRQSSGTRASRSFGLFAGLAVVAVCAVCFAATPAQPPGPQVIGTPRLGKLSGLVQAYAVSRSGRALTGGQVDALYSHLAAGGHAKARALCDRFAMAQGPAEREPSMEDMGLSKPCVGAIQDELQEASESFAKLLVDAFFGCVVAGGDESEECAAATGKMDHFLLDRIAKCQVDGGFCNITVGVEGKRVQESQGVCVPSACHKEAKKAMKCLKEQMQEQVEEAEEQGEGQAEQQSKMPTSVDDCENCTISIECAQAQGAGGRTSSKLGSKTPGTAAIQDADRLPLQDATHLSEQSFRSW